MGWKDRLDRMQASIVGRRGPSVLATYRAPNGAEIRISGPYESPYQKQTPQDQDYETIVVSQEPRFGVRRLEFTDKCPLRQGATLTIDDEPDCKYRVHKIEDTVIGWVDLVLEKIKK